MCCLNFAENSKLPCLAMKMSREMGKEKNPGSEEPVNNELFHESRRKAGIICVSETQIILNIRKKEKMVSLK